MAIPKPPAQSAGPSVQRGMRVPEDLDEELTAIAEACETNWSALVLHFLRWSVDEYKREHGEPKPSGNGKHAEKRP